MITEIQYNRIKAYLDKKLTPGEEADFMLEVNNDEHLKEAFEAALKLRFDSDTNKNESMQLEPAETFLKGITTRFGQNNDDGQTRKYRRNQKLIKVLIVILFLTIIAVVYFKTR